MNANRVQKIINNVNANFSIEGMPLTKQDKDRIRLCLTGQSSFEETIQKLIDKHTIKRV